MGDNKERMNMPSVFSKVKGHIFLLNSLNSMTGYLQKYLRSQIMILRLNVFVFTMTISFPSLKLMDTSIAFLYQYRLDLITYEAMIL